MANKMIKKVNKNAKKIQTLAEAIKEKKVVRKVGEEESGSSSRT